MEIGDDGGCFHRIVIETMNYIVMAQSGGPIMPPMADFFDELGPEFHLFWTTILKSSGSKDQMLYLATGSSHWIAFGVGCRLPREKMGNPPWVFFGTGK